MSPNWISEVLERRKAEGSFSNEALHPSERRSEWEQRNSCMKVKVEQLPSGCRLYVPRDWGRRGSIRGASRPGTFSLCQFVKPAAGHFPPTCR